MRLFVQRNEEGVSIPGNANGPDAGHVFPYFTTAGVPVGFDESFMLEDLEAPVSGMVVSHARTQGLYAIDVDGNAIPIGLKIPANYKDGSRLGADVEIPS